MVRSGLRRGGIECGGEIEREMAAMPLYEIVDSLCHSIGMQLAPPFTPYSSGLADPSDVPLKADCQRHEPRSGGSQRLVCRAFMAILLTKNIVQLSQTTEHIDTGSRSFVPESKRPIQV